MEGLKFAGLSTEKPVLMMMGGSLGSRVINENLRKALPEILKDFQVIHLCGKGNLDEALKDTPGYVQFEYISAQLKDLFAAADIVLSRAGANSICELLALHKPNILVPLSAKVSRGDQILNANSFKKQGYSYVLEEEAMTPETLTTAIREVYENRQKYRTAMENSQLNDGISSVMKLINSACGGTL
jgi:UDP-N-acetylglucosamine--N-acetylmuramyl-(pentapeptide) pyrophosphoryl-undecaprenol N-acetylglucosamine transferase